MPTAPKSMQDVDLQVSVADPAAIREQLQRLLTHPLFANSRRYPALLAYTVEETLKGNATELKERSIGIEVFGRTPTYDANADPVVRITAGEVRKRLSLYYYDSSHTGEVVIELPLGSYVPVFRQPEPVVEPAVDALDVAAIVSGAARHTADSAPTACGETFTIPLACCGGADHRRLRCGSVCGDEHPPDAPTGPAFEYRSLLGAVYVEFESDDLLPGRTGKKHQPGFDQFLRGAGQHAPAEPQKLYVRLHLSGNLALADVITLTRTAAALEMRHKAFRVVPASEASFAQLREGPIVLIGAFDNIWTLRVTQKLRFGFESKDGVALIVDRKSQTKTTWATAWDLPYQKLSRDYAIVARIHDSTTGQPVIIAAGISEEGTEAAGEILYNPVYLNSLVAKAPADWEKKNMEAVIETQVIEGHSGPPNILAVETW